MDQLGLDFNATGSVMSKEQLEEQRRKRGECLTCGRKCFQKKVFKMIPITDHGFVLNGRCLNCYPLEIEKGSEVLPAAARPATMEDIERFSQTSLQTSHSPDVLGQAVVGRSNRRPSSLVSSTVPGSHAPSSSQNRHKSGTSHGSSTVSGNQVPSCSSLSTSSTGIGGDRAASSTRSVPVEVQMQSQHRRQHPGSRQNSFEQDVSFEYSQHKPAAELSGSAGSARREQLERSGFRQEKSNPSMGSEHEELINPAHGNLDRGGAIVFNKGNVHVDASIRTLSLSSIEEEIMSANAALFGGSKQSPSANHIYQKPTVAGRSKEESSSDESETRQRRSSRRSTVPASTGPTVPSTTVDAERRALQKIERAEDDFKEIIRVMKKHPSSDRIQQEALKSLSNCQFSRKDYAELLELNTAAIVVNGMRLHPRCSDVQMNGCKAVWNLSATAKSQLELMNTGALEAVLAAMDEFPDHAEIQEKAMAALSNLGAIEASQEAILQSQAIERIVAAMNKHAEDSQVQMKGCAAITNFASHDLPLKKAIVEAGGGGAVVVSMVMHAGEVDLQEKALRALRNLCAHSEENKKEVANVGGIDAIISAMQVHRNESAVQEAGAWTLANLSQNKENSATIGDSGGIDVIIRAMWVHSENVRVQEWCCRALLSLSADIQNRKVILEVGGIPAMVNAMQGHLESATVQEKCCGTLNNLAALDEDTKLRIVDEEALDAIVMAMVLFPENRNLQDRACSVLRRLAIPQNVKQMQAANVGQLVKIAMEKFPNKCGDKGRYILSVL